MKQNSLILYKNQAGRVTAVDKKITIQLADGQTLSVRPKDVLLLHPGPIQNLAELRPPDGDVLTAWELLAGEMTTLAELSELAYEAITPATVWALWQMLDDGLYFSGTPEEVVVHSAEQVAEIRTTREAKAAEEQAWADFLVRLGDGNLEEGDGRFLQDTVALARGQLDRSRVLQALNQAQTVENAHKLLLDSGYWDSHVNPYPYRFDLTTNMPEIGLPDLPDEERRDLTHLTALAIDDEGNQDPDDALSWDNGRLWVHIADVAALVPPDSPADAEARARGANLYLPEGTITMLPTKATGLLGLGLSDVSPALSFCLDVTESGEVELAEVMPSWVRVTRLTYAEAEMKLTESPFCELHAAAQKYGQRRLANGAVELELPEVRIRVVEGTVVIRPLPKLASRDLVREAMLMTGEAVGRFALQHNIPLPFTTQDPPYEVLDLSGGVAAMFAQRRNMQRSQQSSAPGAHAGLGMGLYVQCTSPLRRYLDMVVHQQLRAWLRDEGVLDGTTVMERVGAADAVSGAVRQAERQSNQHWTLVYLQQNPDWQGEGIVVEKRGKQDVLLLPDLDWETRLHQKGQVEVNGRVTVAVKSVNLPKLEALFKYA